MTKLPKEPPFTKMMDYSKFWQEIWGNVVGNTQKDLLSFYREHTHLPKQEHNPVFDQEVIAETFAKAMPKLMEHPEKVIALQQQHLLKVREILSNVLRQARIQEESPIVKSEVKDKRFKNDQWRENPYFSMLQQLYLLNSQLLRETVNNIEGLDDKTRHKLEFYTRHLIDSLSPTNFPMTNPDVLEATYESKGDNLVQGFKKFLKHRIDGEVNIPITDMKAFRLGENLAATPGKVVYRNELFELIKYDPTTETVAQIPLLIIPPWINKYYIFDLKPENSFVKWATDSGLTVFIISWANPDEHHANKSLSDYVIDGANEALEQVRAMTHQKEVNVVGYCTGGVLLNCLLSYLRAHKKKTIRSATLVASPVDFTEAGDLLVFVCEQQLEKMKKHMDKKGYLEGSKMVQAFNLLRANDLIWTSYVDNYLLAKDPMPFDLLYWNCDAVRMPAKMHGDFLRKMYLENKLIQPGGIRIKGTDVNLSQNDLPMFIMGAIDDHIAPWRSVFPMMNFNSENKKFVLAGSGHVAGVINHPVRQKYNYWQSDKKTENPDDWLANAEKVPGSWWTAWRKWLEQFEGEQVAPHKVAKKRILGEAPGIYVKSVSD